MQLHWLLFKQDEKLSTHPPSCLGHQGLLQDPHADSQERRTTLPHPTVAGDSASQETSKTLTCLCLTGTLTPAVQAE
jgi:hypothetical protein